MAKQKYSNSSSVETNSFFKGMIKDLHASFQPKENWSHARNAYNNSVDGDTAVIGNEPANLQCGVAPYTIIGFIHKRADQWYIFSTDDTNSEIGFYDESTCSYTTILNDPCLNFNRRYLITGAAKENYDCTWQIYWDDSNNPSRTLNIDDIPWIKKIVSTPGADCVIYEDTDELDCEKLRLAPILDTPCVELTRAQDGGLLRNGTYQAYIAYVENEQVVTDYIGISNLQSLFSHDNNSGSLNVKLTKLDKDFEYYQLVILSNNQQNLAAKIIGIYSTEQSEISIDYIDPAAVSVDFTLLFARRPAYEKSDAMYVVNDYLIRQGPTEQFDFNYQPLANQISAEWVVAEYPESYYYKGGNKTSFLRDEVYSFFIRWIYNTGERSKSYHIPGRPSVGNELNLNNGINSIDGPNYNFEVFNTATQTSTTPETLPDGGLVIAKGKMAYWQSTERYPATKPEIWNSTYVDPDTGVNIGGTINTIYDLCGKPIRHHKMPTEEISPNLHLYNSSSNTIRILGVQFGNISRPKFNDGTYIPNIVGYEILRGSREGAKSILAKGVFRNMRKYTIPNNSGNLQGLYPNYPYNDLRKDIYFHDGTDIQDPKNVAKRTDGCDNLENSVDNFKPLDGFTRDVFTFHSPELMFKKPYLNAYEARLYGELHGISNGYFKASELHPQNKLIRNVGALLAGIIGVGYAINAINGTVTKTVENNSVDTSSFYAGGQLSPVNIVTKFNTTGFVYGANTAWEGIKGALFDDVAKVTTLFAGNIIADAAESAELLINQASVIASPLTTGVVGYKTIDSKNRTDAASAVPGPLQTLVGVIIGKQKIAEGAQEIIDVLYNFIKESDFAFKHNSHAELFNYKPTVNGQIYRTKINEQNYIGSSFQVFDSQYKINNLFRPKTAAVSLAKNLPDPSVIDTSRYVIGGNYNQAGTDIIPTYDYLKTPGVARNENASMRYGALKFNFQNQYGQIEGIKQVLMKGCINLIDFKLPANFKYTSELIFSGDAYVGRYTEKVIMPIFSDFLLGQPDNYTYDYLKRVNIPYPRFWMNTQKYDTAGLANKIINETITLGFSQAESALPNDLFYLDRGDSCFKLTNIFSNSDPNPAFAMRYAYMYTHVNGILDFFTESEINLAQRDWEDRRKDRHYDPYEYTDLDELFHAEIIKEDNFYKYDYSLSASRFVTNLTSFGEVQTRDYNPYVAEECFNYYPKRLIYSLQAQEEAKKDFWRVFLPNNYKDFNDKVSVIKPISKTGAIIFFPYRSPQLFQGVDTLQTDLGTKLTIGDGGLFNQPLQNITNSDLPNEYGSVESARSIINTPLGLFYLSQAQGKVFQYTGSLDNIANRGMKWWFNKYLPSILIREFPELEETPLADNPVIGVGCQSVYDINDDIVYFCKKDFSVKPQFKAGMTFDPVDLLFIYTDPSGMKTPIALGDPFYFNDACWTVSYDPKAKAWISFHDWCPELTIPSINHFLTTKTINRDGQPYCPPGYNYNPTTGTCEKTIDESAPAVVNVEQVEAIITGASDCLIDIVIAVDVSGSTGGLNGAIAKAEKRFVKEFINNPNIQAGLSAGNIQMGFVTWDNAFQSMDMDPLNPNSITMSNLVVYTAVETFLNLNWSGNTTDIPGAMMFSNNILNDKINSQLGDRTANPSFKQYLIILTDAETTPPVNTGCPYQSSTLGGSCSGLPYQYVIGVYANDPNRVPVPPSSTVLERITCNQSAYEYTISSGNLYAINSIANTAALQACPGEYTCDCPEGYTLVYPDTILTPVRWTEETGDCTVNSANTYAPICRKVTCECPPPPGPWSQTTTTGECDNVYLAGPNGDPNYVNPDPLICYYKVLKTTPSSLRAGSIWRHNYRCDLYSNYYGVDYPWEVEFIENTGQVVNTVRSVEYQLESYVYKGDLYHGCGDDRWHDLDFNFDEAIIYNTEQVSGLLRLELNPKEDPYNILQYPIIGPSDIRILYSKEEQKYRFNQFWDVTNDRGEFSNAQQEIFITQLNGYIRDLNANNMNYQKAEDQRKKFRHYYNKVLLRRKKSGNRKMLLKLANTKLLLSLR